MYLRARTRGERLRRERLARSFSTRLRRDDGFFLVEATVAVGLAAILILVLGAAMGASLRSSLQTKRLQQASALGTEAVEEAKDLAYAALTMVTADLVPALDSRLMNSSQCAGFAAGDGPYFVDPDGDGPLRCEEIVSRATGAISPHIDERTVNGLQFTVWRYVTWINTTTQGAPGRDLKRIVVMVEWGTGGPTNTYRISGTAVDARRGLPAPEFEIVPGEQGRKVLQGHQVVFAHRIRNLGVTDSYELEMVEGSEEPVRGWTNSTYRVYLDANANRELDDGEVELTDTDEPPDGLKETPDIPPDESVDILIVWDLQETDAAGVESMKLVVHSLVDSEFSKAADDRLEIIDEPVPLTLNLHNLPTPPEGPTAATADLPMDEIAPTSTLLYPYSSDVAPDQAGRVIETSTPIAVEEPSPRRMTNWVFQVPYRTPYTDNATLDLFVLPGAGQTCDALNASVTAYLRDMAAPSGAAQPPFSETAPPFTGPYVASGDACKGTLLLPLGGDAQVVDAGRWVELKLVSSTGVTIAYDTTALASKLTLPQASVPIQVPTT